MRSPASARVRVLVLMLCVFGVTTGEFVIAGILPDIAGDLRVSIPSAGLLVTAYAIGMIVGGPPLTALTARLPRKPLLVALLAVVVLGNLASALAPAYGVLFAARILSALVTSTFFANAIVIATSAAPPEKAASTIAKLAFGMNLSMMLGAPIGTFVGGHLGWRATFAAIAVCCAVGLLLVAWLIPGGPRPARGTSAISELRVFRSGAVCLAIAVTAVANAGILAVFAYFAPLVTTVSGFAAGAVPVLLLAYGAGAAVGTMAGGRLSDRAPMRAQLGLLAALAAALVAAWFAAPSAPATAVLVVLLGGLGFAVIPGMQSRVLATATAAPTLAIAVNAAAYQVAAAVAGWLGGQVIRSGLGARSIYLVAAAVTVAGLAVSAYAWSRARRTTSAPEPSEPAVAADVTPL